MAGSINKVILIGNLGKDPELRFTGMGQPVCNFSIATSESWKNKQGKSQERTEWHRITAWGKLAELCAQYLSKGRKAYVEGHLQTRKWQDKDKTERYITEVVAREVVFLSSAESQTKDKETDTQEPYDSELPPVDDWEKI